MTILSDVATSSRPRIRPVLWPRAQESFVFIVFILLVGCGSVSELPRPQAVTSFRSLESSDGMIVPGERIGPVLLSGQIEDVVRLFGNGRDLGRGLWRFSKIREWDEIGLWIDFDAGTGNIFLISIDATGLNVWRNHAISGGIRLGALDSELMKIMGTPERYVRGGGSTSVYYDRRGIRFTVNDAGLSASQVRVIRVVWPNKSPGDTLIVPGKRISNVELGMSAEQVLAQLGGGYHRAEPWPGRIFYYWPHFGLGVEVRAGRIFTITAAKEHSGDAAGIIYAVDQSVGYGSHADEIKRQYGTTQEIGPCGGWQCWTYRNRGVNFSLDDESRVRVVDVFPVGR